MDAKNIFMRFLRDNFSDRADTLLAKFEAYHKWLAAENAKINLFSRRMCGDDIWTAHFLDSLLSAPHVDFCGRTILDFGTGGGLPGIPLAIIYEESGARVTMLDATKKKIAAVKQCVDFLELRNCDFIDARLEEIFREYENRFDIIVSRSVKIEKKYKPMLRKMLKSGGQIVLYKSKVLDDVLLFDGDGDYDVRIFDVGDTAVRKIVVVTLV